MPQAPRISIQKQPDSVHIKWSDCDQTINFNHSFTNPGRFFGRTVDSNQALLKACSNRRHSIQSVLDLTGGWGIDSFILAQHGKQVTVIEQNPVIYSVLSASLGTARQYSHTQAAAQRITLKQDNSYNYLKTLGNADYDCIYLDPMFPEHRSTAKPGKAMQLLQNLTENLDIAVCFDLAPQKAGKRVVGKRPARATTISSTKPDLSHYSKTIRFDIYLTGC